MAITRELKLNSITFDSGNEEGVLDVRYVLVTNDGVSPEPSYDFVRQSVAPDADLTIEIENLHAVLEQQGRGATLPAEHVAHLRSVAEWYRTPARLERFNARRAEERAAAEEQDRQRQAAIQAQQDQEQARIDAAVQAALAQQNGGSPGEALSQ